MSMFAYVIPGQALQTAVQIPETPERFVGQIADASSLNHLCVFLASPFPEGYGCTLHLGLPGKDFQLIGSLSNAKPSTILRLRGTFVASTQTAGHFAASAQGLPNADVGTLGIVCEPLEDVQRQVAALGAAKADVGALTSTAMVLAGAGQSPDPVTLAQKVAMNFVNHVMGFVKEDGAGGSWIDLRVVQNWRGQPPSLPTTNYWELEDLRNRAPRGLAMPLLWSRQTLPYALALFIITGYFTLRSYTSSRDPELAFLSDSARADSFAAADSNKLPSNNGAGAGGAGHDTPARPLLRPNKSLASSSGSDPFLSTAPKPEALYEALIPTLHEMVNRVIPTYRDSLALETKRCPITHRQSNPDQVKGDGRWWATATIVELGEARSKLAADVVEAFGFTADLDRPQDDKPRSIQSKLSSGEWKELFGKGGNGGRGLVFTAGNKDTANRLLTSLRILRKHLGCTLPAEVWGFESELAAMGDARAQIEELGGVTFHAVAQNPVPGLWKQFQIKGEAIRRSSFTSLLYLDSDNIPVRDPSFLFDAPLFREHGVVLWPDYNKDGAANPIWRLTGAPCNATEWQVESGQLLINKLARGGLNLAALMMAEAMQRDPDFWFKISGGDKDTFRYAFHFLGIPYSPAPHWVAAAGALIPTFEGHRFCGHSMIQFGLSPAEWADTETDADYEPPLAHAPPLFVHANLLKHSGYNNQRGSTFDYIKAANPDLTSVINSRVMKDVRARVYNHRGMCADIWDSSSEANEGVGLQVEGAYDVGHVIIFDFGESSGGLLRNFEERYFSEGGVAGAW